MRPLAAARGFLRSPMRRRLLALEALAELARARVLTLLPIRVYTRDLGPPAPVSDSAVPVPARPEEDGEALAIGDAVAAVAAHVPFRALCLQQAIAVRRMLTRRGVPAAVFLGVSRDAAERRTPSPLGHVAHAWVEVGGRVVSGWGDLERYAVIARFG